METYFDRVAGEYAGWYRGKEPLHIGFNIRKRHLLELFGQRGGDVLDVGCGPGVLVEDLLARKCKVWGIDLSANMIAECHKVFGDHQDVHFSVGTADDLPYPDESFDAVVCMGVIDRLREIDGVIEEMTRVLKPGGTLLVSVPNQRSPYLLWRTLVIYPLIAALRPLYYWWIGAATPGGRLHQTLYTERSFGRLLQRGGCSVTDVVYFVFNPLLSPLDRIFPRLAGFFLETFENLVPGKARRLGYGFIMKARKT